MTKVKRRVCEPPVQFTPFFTRGNTWRNEIPLPVRGWYFCDDRGVLFGPCGTKLDCTNMIEAYTEDMKP